MSIKTETLLSAPPLRLLLQMTGPNTLAFALQSLVILTEVWIISQLGTQGLAAIALVFPLLILNQTMSAGAVGGAISSAIARRLGKGDTDSAEKLIWQGLYLSFLVASFFLIMFILFGERFLRFLGGDGAILDAALSYCYVLFFGGFFIWLSAATSSVFRGCGNMMLPARLMIIASLVQVPLSGGLVLGWFGMPQLGVTGAALSAILINGTTGTIMLVLLFRKTHAPGLKRAQAGWNTTLMRDILQVARPASLNPLMNVSTILGLTALVGRFGETALAGYGIGTRIEFLMLPIIFAFGTALTTIVGTNVGAGKYDRAEAAGWYGVICAGGFAGGTGVALALFADIWIPLFTDDAEVMAVATQYIGIVGPAYAGLGIGLVLYFASLGAGAMRWPVLGMILRFIISVGGAGVCVLYLNMGLASIFYAGALGMGLYAIFIAVAVLKGAWRPS
jgi:putative MATE family efflux protein